MRVKIEGETIEVHTLWREGFTVKMIDQRKLPHNFEIAEFHNYMETVKAIDDMVLRGAGAIGCAGGYGMAQAALEFRGLSKDEFTKNMRGAADRLMETRPTAVNLFHAVNRCLRKAVAEGSIQNRVDEVLAEADAIAKEDLAASEEMGRIGAKLIEEGNRILTHCNAGALAFIDHGTALSPIRRAHRDGKDVFVWVDETRPRCQGARLTAWEMDQEGIPYSIIVDNAAGYFMRNGEVDMVIVGADRIAANGDVANKIGTYEKAVVARENGIPFYVAAPEMTFDLSTKNGDDVEIEERSLNEVIMMWGVDEEREMRNIYVAKRGSAARNPSFDITPARYISGFITERGLLRAPYEVSIAEAFARQ